MTPKEKLHELLDRLYIMDSFKKKKLSIIVLIDEIKNELSNFDTMHGCGERFDYWEEVKNELEKL